jgi:hypothetical protein
MSPQFLSRLPISKDPRKRDLMVVSLDEGIQSEPNDEGSSKVIPVGLFPAIHDLTA